MSWKRLSILIPIAALSLGNNCNGTPPAVRAKQWLGSSREAGVVSSQNEVLRCNDPTFDNFACMTLEDQSKLLETFFGCCERWKPNCGGLR